MLQIPVTRFRYLGYAGKPSVEIRSCCWIDDEFLLNYCVRAMRDEDIKELIARCRTLAGNADIFTKKRLQDLALRYEAMCEKRPVATPAPKVISLNVSPQPTTIQSVSIQLGTRPDRPPGAN
jgi:hypothetical protein